MKIPNPPSLLRSKPSRRILAASATALLAALAAIPSARSQIVVPGSMTYTQNFDSLGTTTAAWVDNTTIPGWYAGINANATADGNTTVSDGTVAAKDGLLNLGTTGAADRALGSKVTGTGNFANIAFGVLFQNTSVKALDVTNIGYTGELWRTNMTATPVTPEQWVTFTKISAVTFNDVEPGATSPTANVGTFTPAPIFNFSSPTNTPPDTALDGNAAANRTVITADPNILIAPGQFFMFRWVDTNNVGTDGHQGIDDFSISFTAVSSLVYNITHAVGGMPNGVLEVSANQYWLEGAVGAGFASGDAIAFSQNGTATISVPADVTTAQTAVSAASGTYTISGVGKIAGPLLKSNAGTLILTSANSFSSTTISGGAVQAQVAGALGTGPVTFATGSGTLSLRIRDNGAGDNGTLAYGNDVIVANNATLDLDRATGGASVGNTVTLGNLSIGAQTLTVTGANGYKARFDGTTTLTGAATVTTNTEVILQGAISGASTSTLVKAGTGRLTLTSNSNTNAGPITVTAGTIGGTGNVGAALTVNSGATLAPGNSTGIFSTNTNLTLAFGSILSIDLAHTSAGTPVAGTDYDQVKVGTGVGAATTGAVAVGNSNLALTIGTGVQAGDVFIIILNDGTDAVIGTFSGLIQNATLPGGQFRISYTYNSTTSTDLTGNDVALIALPVPEPGTALLALLGTATLLRRRRK